MKQLQSNIFRDISLCNSVKIEQSFGGTHHSHLQNQETSMKHAEVLLVEKKGHRLNALERFDSDSKQKLRMNGTFSDMNNHVVDFILQYGKMLKAMPT
jgi:hypothetical protein